MSASPWTCQARCRRRGCVTSDARAAGGDHHRRIQDPFAVRRRRPWLGGFGGEQHDVGMMAGLQCQAGVALLTRWAHVSLQRCVRTLQRCAVSGDSSRAVAWRCSVGVQAEGVAMGALPGELPVWSSDSTGTDRLGRRRTRSLRLLATSGGNGGLEWQWWGGWGERTAPAKSLNGWPSGV